MSGSNNAIDFSRGPQCVKYSALELKVAKCDPKTKSHPKQFTTNSHGPGVLLRSRQQDATQTARRKEFTSA